MNKSQIKHVYRDIIRKLIFQQWFISAITGLITSTSLLSTAISIDMNNDIDLVMIIIWSVTFIDKRLVCLTAKQKLSKTEKFCVSDRKTIFPNWD